MIVPVAHLDKFIGGSSLNLWDATPSMLSRVPSHIQSNPHSFMIVQDVTFEAGHGSSGGETSLWADTSYRR